MHRFPIAALASSLMIGCGTAPPSNPDPDAGTDATSTSTSGTSSASTGSGGAGGDASGGGGAGPLCLACGALQVAGPIKSDQLTEISGLVAGQKNPGVFYVHNDSGDKARFFAIDPGGSALATFTVTGALAVDWEDIALGPCPSGTCVYIADTGDNLKKRDSYVIYRVPEPSKIADASLDAEAFPFTYPDGPHDVEALLVHPVTGVITLVTKNFLPSDVYELPAPGTPGLSVVAKKIGKVPLPIEPALVTGGNVNPGAKGVLLRTYADAYFFPMSEGLSVADALMGKACPIPMAIEPQGEAIGWLHGGAGYVTVSEGANEPINIVTCMAP